MSLVAAGGSADSLRRRNLAALLTIVHREGAASRSSLTRRTGLNRSTVGGLVAELVERGLVVEGEPEAPAGVGRPSPVVRAASDVYAYAVNPEIDAVTVGAIDFAGRVVERVRRPTAGVPTAGEAIAMCAEELATLRARHGGRVLGVGAAIPGLVRKADGVVVHAPHLGWSGERFGERLAEATGLEVRSANDAHLASRAEAVFGAARGRGTVVYVNGGSSGIGGGVILDGVPLAGASGFAGEIGHTLVDPAGEACHCGSRGCLETVVRRERLLHALGLADADEDELDRALAASSDPDVRAEAAFQVDVLASALRNVVNVVNPDVIVLGGFLASLATSSGTRLEDLVRARALRGPRDDVRLVRAELGAHRLLVGAAELAFDPVLADPAAAPPAGDRKRRRTASHAP